MSENSAKPPTFADEELVKRTEESFEVKIKEPIIVELYAELTPPRDPYSHLFPHENSWGLFRSTRFYTDNSHRVYVVQKEELRVEVPHLKMLSKSKVMDLLIDAEMPFSEFEAYYKHLQTMQNFDTLVDLSGETLKK